MSRATPAAALALVLAASCSRCGDRPAPPQRRPAPIARTAPAGCKQLRVPFAGQPSVVWLCGKQAMLPFGDTSITRLRLTGLASLQAICSGPREKQCLAELARDNLAQSDRVWAPKRFAAAQLLLFFGDARQGDAPALEVVQDGRDGPRSVFYAEEGVTPRPFLYDSLQDLDGDGVPELLGVEAPPELDRCHPYAPMAVFKLQGGRYARDEALMKRWAREHKQEWRGAEPDPKIQICDDD